MAEFSESVTEMTHQGICSPPSRRRFVATSSILTKRFRGAFAKGGAIFDREPAEFANPETHRNRHHVLRSCVRRHQRLAHLGQSKRMNVRKRGCAADRPKRSREGALADGDLLADV